MSRGTRLTIVLALILIAAPQVRASSQVIEPPGCGVLLIHPGSEWVDVSDALGWVGEYPLLDGVAFLTGDDLLPEGGYVATYDDGFVEDFEQPWCDSTGDPDPPDVTPAPDEQPLGAIGTPLVGSQPVTHSPQPGRRPL